MLVFSSVQGRASYSSWFVGHDRVNSTLKTFGFSSGGGIMGISGTVLGVGVG